LREASLGATPEAHELARRLAAGEVGLVVLLTGVGTRALAAACPDLAARLARVPIVARGPKPLAALRELGVPGARPVPDPFTWRQVLVVIDGLTLAPGTLVAVQEYGVPPAALVEGLEARGLRVLRVPVYRWALPTDPAPLRAGAAAVAEGAVDVAVFTNAGQVEHLFQVAADGDALRAGLARAVIASIGPTTSEALEAHGVVPDLEAAPPKMGPLVAAIASRAPALVAVRRAT
jgi:uroporphyrinogen-III synthase